MLYDSVSVILLRDRLCQSRRLTITRDLSMHLQFFSCLSAGFHSWTGVIEDDMSSRGRDWCNMISVEHHLLLER